jgi:hypothetical protein
MRPHGGQPISKRRADQLQRDLDTLRTCLHPELPPEPPAAPSAVDVEARLAQRRAEVETAEARVAEAREAAVRASNVVEQVLADFCAGGRACPSAIVPDESVSEVRPGQRITHRILS